MPTTYPETAVLPRASIAYGTCHICYSERIVVLLASVSYRIPSIRNRLRTLRYCSDNDPCVVAAHVKARK